MEDEKINLIHMVYGTASVILLFTCFIVTSLYFHRKKQLLYIREMEESQAAAKLEIQEQTLQYVSREIHDNISLSLSLSKIHLSTLNLSDTADVHSKLNSSISLIGESLRKLTDLSRRLNSDPVTESGLLYAIEREVGIIRSTGLYNVQLDIIGEPVFLTSHKEIILFRVIQECLNNILKHANASNIKITVTFTTSELHLCINDDGVGISPDKQSCTLLNEGSGLRNIAYRVAQLQGSYKIEVPPGGGTRVQLKIPLTTS